METMYDSLEDRNIECKFCDFAGEFEYEWTEGSFTVICPSCGKVNYEIKKEKIDTLVDGIVKGSLEDLRKPGD
ncbi:MAG: hypothetical protein V3R93_02735 [Candidatus Hydrothermarchaeaceae archaeon]